MRMKLNQYRGLLFALLGSILLLCYLYGHTHWANQNKNGFKRLYIPHPISKTKTIDLGFNSFYLAGLDSQHVYLGNRTAPTYFLISNRSLQHQDTMFLKIPDNNKKLSFKCSVLDQQVYLSDGNNGKIYRSTLPDSTMYPFTSGNIPFFTSALAISTKSIVLKTYYERLKQSTLSKLSLEKPFFWEDSTLLEPSVDGFYSCDGSMCLDQTTGRIFYVYRYRNLFLQLDSNLDLVSRGKTIDTISRPHLKIGSYPTNEGTTTTFQSPSFDVNKNACCSDGLLYIYSSLRADNENMEDFNRYAVLDVYRVSDSRYQFSFYVPKQKKQPISSIGIYHKTLYTISDQYLSLYQLGF